MLKILTSSDLLDVFYFIFFLSGSLLQGLGRQGRESCHEGDPLPASLTAALPHLQHALLPAARPAHQVLQLPR
jgi:hypothetical protein